MVDVKEYKEKLKAHITALEKAYDNVVSVLNQDIKTDKDSGEIKLTNSQIKDYADGIKKASQTANELISMIRDKHTELESLEKEGNKKPDSEVPKIEESDEEKVDVSRPSGSALNEHLS